jgi:hypothetical protein
MLGVSEMESPHLFRCPNGHLGRMDDEQLNGEVSIICNGNYGDCDFHGYVGDGEVVEKNKYSE